jgi:hypothetical protein
MSSAGGRAGPKQLPPSPEERAIAAEVNERLGNGGRVTFYLREQAEGMQPLYGMVLEYMTARKPVERDYPFLDLDEIMLMHAQFREAQLYQPMRRWSVVP